MARDLSEDYIIGASATLFAREGSIIGGQAPRHGLGQPTGEPLELALADLLPDTAGEVVVSAGDGVALRLKSELPLRDSGVCEEHVTVTGVDVTGLYYYSFVGGVTVYSPEDIEVLATA
jgi:hypothetical protein